MQKSQLKYVKTPEYLRRSSLNSQNSSSPKKTVNQTLNGSQLNQEISKSQHSLRSSNSPVGHCKSQSSNAFPLSPTRSLQKRPSQIISKQQLQSMHQRSIIKMLGLNMEAICTKANHEKNKMIYICQYPDCQADNRLGCSYCQIEQHANHSTENIEIQTFCRIFDDRRQQFENLCNQIMQPPDRATQIKTFFGKLRINIQERLQDIEENVLKSVQEHLMWQPLEKDIQNRVNYLSSKNIFDMTQDELIESISFLQGKHLQEVEYIIKETQSYLTEKIQQVDQAWNDLQQQLEFDLSSAINDNNKIQFFETNQKKEYAQQKLQVLQIKQKKYKEQFLPYQQIMDDIIEEERKIAQYKEQEIKKQIEQKKLEIVKQKQEQKRKEIEYVKMKEEQRKRELEQEREKQLRTFPHILYTEDCPHRLPCNTIPIFACCNKAYPCTQCHGYLAHPPRISIPSYRYCMKCLEIYLVLFPTNQSVNCLKCQLK